MKQEADGTQPRPHALKQVARLSVGLLKLLLAMILPWAILWWISGGAAWVWGLAAVLVGLPLLVSLAIMVLSLWLAMMRDRNGAIPKPMLYGVPASAFVAGSASSSWWIVVGVPVVVLVALLMWFAISPTPRDVGAIPR